MGFEILPYEDGDDERYDVIEITHSDRWVPARFQDKLHQAAQQHESYYVENFPIMENPKLDPSFVLECEVLY